MGSPRQAGRLRFDADVTRPMPRVEWAMVDAARSRQGQRLKRIGMVSGLAAVFVLFCAAARAFGYLQVPGGVFAGVYAVWLGGFLLAAWLIASGRKPAVVDSVMTLAVWLWGNAGILFGVGCALPSLRPMLLSGFLVGALFAAQRLPPGQVLAVNALTVLAYAVMVVLQAAKLAAPLDVRFELLVLAGLVIVLGIGAGFSSEVAALRRVLRERNAALSYALERVRELAIRDELTGLYNRRYLMDVLQQQKALADRGTHGFAVAYLDLDYFKQVNDALGHGQGDRILRRFAQIALGAVREGDIVARFGGEEFVIVLVGADLARARIVAERIRGELEAVTIPGTDAGFRVTTSVGVAEYHGGEPIEETLARADGALYAAKRNGRNRVVMEAADSNGPY